MVWLCFENRSTGCIKLCFLFLDFGNRIWSAVSTALEAAATVVSGLVNFIKTHGCRKTNTEAGSNIAVHVSKYKISLCRDLATNGACPRGINCTFAHSEEELMKFVSEFNSFLTTYYTCCLLVISKVILNY